jgi:hypothetical protein
MDEDSDAIIVAGEGLPRSSSPRQHPNLALLVVVVGVLAVGSLTVGVSAVVAWGIVYATDSSR